VEIIALEQLALKRFRKCLVVITLFLSPAHSQTNHQDALIPAVRFLNAAINALALVQTASTRLFINLALNHANSNYFAGINANESAGNPALNAQKSAPTNAAKQFAIKNVARSVLPA
jgi:hypothetical protein